MPVKLEHRIGVQAPAEVIWESLFDVPGWEGWNPLYPRAAGVIHNSRQPMSGRGLRATPAPMARASCCAPKQ